MEDEKKLIAKSMLIVKSGPTSLKGVEQFLRNRDWKLDSTFEVKDAIVVLSQKKPSFVLIALDHPNSLVKKLPKIILSAFPCCVMVFVEKSNSMSFKALTDSSVDYKVNPPVTGPAIERAVNKFLRDQQQVAKNQASEHLIKSSGKSKDEFEFNVEIKRSSETDSSFISSGASEKGNSEDSSLHVAHQILAQLENESGRESGAIGGDSFIRTEKSGRVESIGTDSPLAQKDSELMMTDAAMKKLAEQASSPADLLTPNAVSLEKRKDSNQNKPSLNHDSVTSEGFFAETLDPQNKKTNRPEKPNPEQPEDFSLAHAKLKTKSRNSPQKPQSSNPDAVVGIEINELESFRGRKSKRDQELEKKLDDEESVLAKSVSQALDQTVLKGDGKVNQVLQDSSHLACIVIESSRFSGYLVAALGKNKKIDKNFIDLVKYKLVKFLTSRGEQIGHESNLDLKVRQVDFEGWALEYAQFLRKSVHNGDQVAMAFFPNQQVQPVVGISASEEMVSIQTQDIQTNVELEFNMYIYLPSNKKYILYTPQGGKFLSDQKERLARQGVQMMHIQKEDVQNLGKFKAQNHLNSLIQEYSGNASDDRSVLQKKKSA